MKPGLKLIAPTPPPISTCLPRRILTIVKALGLDNVKLPDTQTSRKSVRKPAGTTTPASNDGRIPESGRNNTLIKLAGSMRRKGMGEPAILAALQAENIDKCDPPLDASEVKAIAASIMRYPAANTDDLTQSLNDAGNAGRFGARHNGEVVYVPGFKWHLWDGLLWRPDRVGTVMELAKQVARDIFIEASVISEDPLQKLVRTHANNSLKTSNLEAALKLSRSLPELVVRVDQLDSHDMMLGVANGVIDLHTGQLMPVRRDWFMTRHSPVAFDVGATCPQFTAFIDQITDGNKILASYLQRMVGYALTGLTNEQCLFFLFGIGANGKSVFLNVVKELLGSDLACQTPSESLMVKKSGSTNDIARLQNLRAVIANEVEDGSLLAESLVKQMTGGEVLTARFLFQEFFQFMPKFKLFIAGNHKPTIRGRDDGIWRRIRLIPFSVIIPKEKQDKHLQSKLRAELPGILNWAIKGCQDWKKYGLDEPQMVSAAVAEYREEMDLLSGWIFDCCDSGPAKEWKSRQAYGNYKVWAEGGGYRPMSESLFCRELGMIYKKVKRNDGNYFLGITQKAFNSPSQHSAA